jgi:hypothetical protein
MICRQRDCPNFGHDVHDHAEDRPCDSEHEREACTWAWPCHQAELPGRSERVWVHAPWCASRSASGGDAPHASCDEVALGGDR